MTSRVTRATLAKEAAFLNSDKENATPIVSSPPPTPKHPVRSVPLSRTKTSKKLQAPHTQVKLEDSAAPQTPSACEERSALKGRHEVAEHDHSLADGETSDSYPSGESVGRKRKRAVKHEDSDEYLGVPHNLGPLATTKRGSSKSEDDQPIKSPGKKSAVQKRTSRLSDKSVVKTAKDEKDAERAVLQLAQVKTKFTDEAERRQRAISSGKKSKSETYGLCEGETPFPRWQHPTPEECQEVHELLLKHHPDTNPQPQTIPPPSEFVAGCGEVRSILDALVRTRLSASTTGRNSNAAYQGMVQRYGLLKSGVGKGSVNYNAVRIAPVQDLFYAIKGGGLAVSKSADIKAVLDIVFDENQARREELLAAKDDSISYKGPKGASVENEKQKATEIKLAEDENLSLDHFYTLPTYDAIYKFMTFPGIGVKTAACVAMFSMQRPVFAVDTHVFRLAKWLGWVPPPEEKQKGDKSVDRDTTFSHLEIRIPDDLKYMLHQLFIKHGKTCPRCRGNTGEGSQGWAKGCPIDHLVQRSGPRKSNIDSPASTKSLAKKRKTAEESEEDDESEEMPDLDDQDEGDGGPIPMKKKAKAPTKAPTTSAAAVRSTRAKDTADVPSPKGPTMATKRKRKSAPRNGWRGGKAISSREASTDR
ncbi:uncharacterized protein KY384_006444 [Bacidia gigantensis]|uniref:uncharacterized protein n=1 Tax=Bacidia gigantensis TaxID=2732470 RepID=UPI001D05765A|nr:uncharacterized protein KY384_006444 [Bacidia gigantensis]KAG8528757.1 hypothetical protein KY384_006444 [Bacidia gigantensis]